MKYLSLFSGIGGFDLPCEELGMECVGQVEINEYCLETLDYHFPNAPKFRDVKDVGNKTHERKTIDLICGGFPCQDLSVAGKRKGLAGERSGLWYEFARIIDELEPKWVVAENVPGLLSTWGGDDFAIIVSWLAKRGYGVAYRVLDAQYFGVPQRRRRVFIVASFGTGCAAKVLFESQSGKRNTEESGEEGQGTSSTIASGINGSGLRGRQPGSAATYVINDPDKENQANDVVPVVFDRQSNDHYKTAEATVSTVASRDYKRATDLIAYNIQQNDGGDHKRKDRPNGGMYVNETDTALTVGSTDLTAIAVQQPVIWDMSHADDPVRQSGEVAATLRGFGHGWQGQHNDTNAVVVPTLQSRMGTGGNQVPMVGVRRLTPTECERLQGFPDGWTAVNDQSDSTRYKQLGNAVAVPVVRWIMSRIVQVEKGDL